MSFVAEVLMAPLRLAAWVFGLFFSPFRMVRAVVIWTLVILLVGGAVVAVSALAQEAESPSLAVGAETGQLQNADEVYQRHEKQARALLDRVNQQILSMAEDGAVHASEMRVLENFLNDYDGHRAYANHHLKSSGRELTDEADPALRQALDIYFDGWVYVDDEKQTVRWFFSVRAEKEVGVVGDYMFGPHFLFMVFPFVLIFLGFVAWDDGGWKYLLRGIALVLIVVGIVLA